MKKIRKFFLLADCMLCACINMTHSLVTPCGPLVAQIQNPKLIYTFLNFAISVSEFLFFLGGHWTKTKAAIHWLTQPRKSLGKPDIHNLIWKIIKMKFKKTWLLKLLASQALGDQGLRRPNMKCWPFHMRNFHLWVEFEFCWKIVVLIKDSSIFPR